ncbi:MAG: helix-turn-helix domain-containing protein [Acholeplasmatales bacterium]|nr:helix-turn-helix domain-containing protein [Methanobrevibacter sp.]MBP5446436.1 helix-turn-helix domain-containing protein [Acholeplasmatales bacterium]
MQKVLTKLLTRTMREIADKIDAGNSHLSEEEQSEILAMLTHTAMSAEEVCEYLNISRPTLTNHIRDGLIPKGRKLRGRKELIWYKDELINVIKS